MAKGRQGGRGLMAQVQQMQAQLQQAQAEIAAAEVDGTAGGGAVRVVLSGTMDCKRVILDPAILEDADVEMLEDLFTAAVNQALEKARMLAEKKMGPITGGLGGMLGMGG